MFGRTPRLNPLESRRRLLIAESDLNRGQLQVDWQALTAGLRHLADPVKPLGPLASAAALLVAGVAALRPGKSGGAAAHPSWLHTAFKGAQLAGSLWLAFRARSR